MRVATFNVHRFFDTNCDSGECGPGDFEEQFSPAQFASRAEELFRAIEDLDAEIVLLQELETQACLDAILAQSDGDWTGQLGEIGTSGSVDVAVVARVPMLGVKRHRPDLQLADGRQSIFSRVLLEIHFQVEETRVVVFAAHFRSKANDDPLRRLAEAEVSAQLALDSAAEFPDALVLMGGDLNDEPGSPPINALEESGLLRVAAELGAEAGTFVFNGRAQAIDHLFLAPAGGGYLAGSAAVVPPGGLGYGGSDHSALSASFLLTSPD